MDVEYNIQGFLFSLAVGKCLSVGMAVKLLNRDMSLLSETYPGKTAGFASKSPDARARHRAAIRTFLWEHFEMGDATIEQEWTGILGWSCDDAPWVGAVPGQQNAYVCAGFCGSGLSRAFMCGLSVGDMAAGEPPRQQVDKWVPDLRRGWSADIRAGHAVTAGTTRADRVYKDEAAEGS